eukprot:TRINITY_DN3090_c0_g2_i3.p1 TRINITY_DN3090_c0_g2~~TRINITY_DN3090_c0_g2_i3.p1  ORF type:complete len:209 (+),score=-18.36 TRINITY_DN3090_c0_g2_i3:431-1057(+)
MIHQPTHKTSIIKPSDLRTHIHINMRTHMHQKRNLTAVLIPFVLHETHDNFIRVKLHQQSTRHSRLCNNQKVKFSLKRLIISNISKHLQPQTLQNTLIFIIAKVHTIQGCKKSHIIGRAEKNMTSKFYNNQTQSKDFHQKIKMLVGPMVPVAHSMATPLLYIYCRSGFDKNRERTKRNMIYTHIYPYYLQKIRFYFLRLYQTSQIILT